MQGERLILDFDEGEEPWGWQRFGKEGLTVTVVRDPEEMRFMRPDCRGLRLASDAKQVAIDLPYFAQAWETVAKEGDVRLRIIAVERDDTPIAIWPLYLDRKTNTLRHLSCSSFEEYAGALWAEPSEEVAELLVSAALREASVIEAYNLLPDDPLAKALRRRPIKHISHVRSPIIRVAGHETGEEWSRHKSRSFRQTIRTGWNGLRKMGKVEARLTEPAAEGGRFVDWFFETKRQWAAERGEARNWLHNPRSSTFFKQVLAKPESGVQAFQVTCDGHIVAGVILLMSKDIEFFAMCTDPAYSAFSPGHLLLDALVDLGAKRGQDIDLRITQDGYKLRWADDFEDRETIVVASNFAGARIVAAKKLRTMKSAARKIAGRIKRAANSKARGLLPRSP